MAEVNDFLYEQDISNIRYGKSALVDLSPHELLGAFSQYLVDLYDDTEGFVSGYRDAYMQALKESGDNLGQVREQCCKASMTSSPGSREMGDRASTSTNERRRQDSRKV